MNSLLQSQAFTLLVVLSTTANTLGQAGSTCANPVTISSLPYNQTGQTTSGFGDDYSSADACGSYYMTGDDFVYEYTPASSESINISLTNTGTWVGLFVTQGCPDLGTCINSSTSSSGNPSLSDVSLTGGITYYIVISTWASPQSTAFDIDIILTPAGNTCANPVTISSLPYNQTGQTTSGFGDDYSFADACGSYYMNGDDFVYEYTPASSETIDISLTNTGTWVGLFVTQGCPDIGTCINSSTSSSGNPSLSGVSLTGGITYYIVISTYPSPQSTAFDIDITVSLPKILLDDNTSETICSANFYDMGDVNGSYSSSQDFTKTISPGNGGKLIIEFNSFDVESHSTCGYDYLEIYDGPSTASPLLGKFCGTTIPGPFTSTAAGGELTFKFHSDGSLTNSGWDADLTCTATVTLPIELSYFGVKCGDGFNTCEWITLSEFNNDYYTLEKSFDGYNFKEVAKIDGEGNSVTQKQYSYNDPENRDRIAYYRLKQTDFNGDFTYSKVVSSMCARNNIDIYPNPFGNEIHIQFETGTHNKTLVEIFDNTGSIIFSQEISQLEKSIINLKHLNTGVYHIRISSNNEVLKRTKLIKT